MIACDVVLLASGTAALEAMLAKRPMVVGYRISALTYRLVMALGLLKVNRYACPTCWPAETLVPELMQDDCTPETCRGVGALVPRSRSRAPRCSRASCASTNACAAMPRRAPPMPSLELLAARMSPCSSPASTKPGAARWRGRCAWRR